MTNTIQLTETAQSVQAAIRPAQYQIELAKSQLEKNGLSTSTIDTTAMLINQVEQMVIELTNRDFDDYNQLIDQAEALDDRVVKLEGEVKSLNEKLESANEANVALEGRAHDLLIDINIKKAALREANKELSELKAIDPKRLKDKNVNLKKELEEKRGILNDQRLKIRELTKTVNHLNTANGKAASKNLELSNQNNELKDMIRISDGNTVQKAFVGTADAPKNLEFYIHTLNWGVTSTKNGSESTDTLLSDINWHTILRTTYGVDALIRFTKWLSPVIPEESYYPLSRFISNEIIIALHVYCLENVERSHPQLIQRVEWAKGVSILDVDGVSERHLDALIDGGFKSLYDVMKSVSGSIEARCKGLGEKAEREIRFVCEKFAKTWEYVPESESNFVDEAQVA